MKRIFYLLAAMIATVGVANAQIGNGTSWFRSSEELKCISASGNTFKFDMYGDGIIATTAVVVTLIATR